MNELRSCTKILSAMSPSLPQATGPIPGTGSCSVTGPTTALAPVARQACERAGVDPSELAAFIPHQANLRIIEAIARRLGAPQAKVADDIVTAGNTSSASIPLALSRMIERGEIPSGAPALLIGFGAGICYAAQVIKVP